MKLALSIYKNLIEIDDAHEKTFFPRKQTIPY
jgi:hypothetical protein